MTNDGETGIAVRHADPGRDLAALVELNRIAQDVHVEAEPEFFRPGEDMPGSEGLHRRFTEGPPWYTFVAETAGKVVGYVNVEHYRREAHTFAWEQNHLHVHELVVHPDHRRKGVGRTLMARVDALATELGASDVALDTWAFNVDAQKFFQAIGFEVYNLRLKNSVLGKPAPGS